MNKSVFVIVLTLLTAPAQAESTDSQRLEKVQKEMVNLTKQQGATEADKKALYKQLEKQSTAASVLKKELYQLEQKIRRQSAKIEQIKHEQKQHRKAHSVQLDALNKQLKSAFENAQPNYLKVLLNQEDPAKLSRSSVYFKYFHQARQQQLNTINDTLTVLGTQQAALTAAQDEQKLLYAKQKKQQVKLENKKQQRLATIKQLDSKLAAQSSRIAALKEQEQALQAVFKAIAEKKPSKVAPPPKRTASVDKPRTKSKQKFSSMKGRLPWPVQGKVTARYGTKRNLGKLTWQGIMIEAPSGKEVKASADGQVVFSGWLRGFGLLIIVDHGDKYMSLYGNNESLLKEVGENVQSGELIALSGDKGIRQHAGLYFEIRHKGSPTNPSKWLGKKS